MVAVDGRTIVRCEPRHPPVRPQQNLTFSERIRTTSSHRFDARTAMTLTRRNFLFSTAAALIVTDPALRLAEPPPASSHMYGLIGKMTATPGQRDALVEILLRGTASMPGCLSYIVAVDPNDPDALWITEVWDSAESHQASLALPNVKAAIAAARPIIAGFSHRTETRPIGGAGLTTRRDS